MAEVVALTGQVHGRTQPRQEDLPLVTVIMPAFNEELVLADNLARTYEYLQQQSGRFRFELLVVDDGSSDSTPDIADTFSFGRPEVRVLHLAVNGHLGKALRSGFRASRGDYVVTLDSDLTYDTHHIGHLLDSLVAHHAHVALASAYMPGGAVSGVPPLRLALSRGANRYLRAAVRGRLSTLTCMVRAYDGDLVRNLSLRCAGTDINTEIVYKAELLGARIIEVPAHLDWETARRDAPGRVSSVKVARSIGQYLKAGLWFRPAALLNGAAAMSAAVLGGCAAVLVALAVRTAWRAEGAVPGRLRAGFEDLLQGHGSLLLGCGILAVLTAQLTGLALLAQQAKRYFEELFDLTSRASWQRHDSQLWEPAIERTVDRERIAAAQPRQARSIR